MEIRYIETSVLIKNIIELCSKVALTYNLKEPSEEFGAHLTNVLKKYYGKFTLENIEQAFEANSVGLMNEYLPKSGYSIDNKVKFSIPDMTKILKAFIRFKNLDKSEIEQNQEPESSVKNASIQRWCDRLEEIFRKYAYELERSTINIPMFTCEVLADIGILDRTKVNYSEERIIVGFKKSIKLKSSQNVDLIYKTFDEILEKGNELKQYLDKFRYKYDENQIPIF